MRIIGQPRLLLIIHAILLPLHGHAFDVTRAACNRDAVGQPKCRGILKGIRQSDSQLPKLSRGSLAQVIPTTRHFTQRSAVFSIARGGEDDGENKRGTNASDVLSYYLLWSPGMWQKTLVTVLALGFLKVLSGPIQSRLGLTLHDHHHHSGNHFAPSATAASSPVHFLIHSVLLPLLSSACCSIQLLINVVVGAGGCAGFNKYLGPLRPYVLSLLGYATVTSFPTGSNTEVMNWAKNSSLRWFVALMPELVHVWNIYGRRVLKSHSLPKESNSIMNGKSSDRVKATIELVVPGMGCVACINKIDASVLSCAPQQVEETKSWLEPSGKGGRTLVNAVASSEEGIQLLSQELVEAVRGAGFSSCTIESVTTNSSGSPES